LNWINFTGIAIVLLGALLIGFFYIRHRAQPYLGLRPIRAYQALRRALNLSVEDGSRVQVSLGSADLLSTRNASALAGLTFLQKVAQLSSISDRPPVATSGNSSLAILSQDTLRTTYQAAYAEGEYDPAQGRLTGLTPFSYAVGTLPVIHDEQVSTNIVVGDFGPEAAYIADAVEQTGCFLLASSNGLPAQSILYAGAQEPLVGEELFAGGAYVEASPIHAASLHAQDILRWGIIAALVIGSIIKLVQFLWI
jgi:hypothetical protein